MATEQEISAEYGIGERTLRTWRTQAHTSGLAGCVVRRGRRVLYDRAAFRRWLELHRGR